MRRASQVFVFNGTVVSGVGEGRYFTQLDWVRRAFLTKVGFEPIAGTFNVKIDAREESTLAALKKLRGIAIPPPDPAFCPAKCFFARIGPVDGALVIPLVEGYRRNLLEIVAPINLREKLGAQDNDPVKVRVYPRTPPRRRGRG